jgi:tRNA modification GTPase
MSMRALSVTSVEDTIVAISTPPGEGGVGIVRLSGSNVLSMAGRFFTSSRGLDILQSRQQVFHGHVHDEHGAALDEVLLHVMRAPHSYTREDVIEINCHGGRGPLNAVLEECLQQGARLAGPGEFTQRAFLNGRIDLVQAEAVIDQIRARTKAGLQAANAAASGTLSKSLYAMADTLRYTLSRVEAAIDFPDEDLPDLIDEPFIKGLRETHRQMQDLLGTSDAGRLYREGASVAIAGRPNVGKSSLFNTLLRDARAIVSSTAGTTRDRIEECITISGIPVKLIDTAGLRVTDDELEQIGIEFARNALRLADVVLFVVDATTGPTDDSKLLAQEIHELDLPVMLVLNKIDLAPEVAPDDWGMEFAGICRVSALTGEGLKELENTLGDFLLDGAHLATDEAMITRVHQKDSLRRATDCIARLLEDPHLSPEFLALELQQALHALGEITGETTPDDILDTIFSDFCIGK